MAEKYQSNIFPIIQMRGCLLPELGKHSKTGFTGNVRFLPDQLFRYRLTCEFLLLRSDGVQEKSETDKFQEGDIKTKFR
ncbi:hypothetical protein RUM43_013443, partial [Polyplax serrata]